MADPPHLSLALSCDYSNFAPQARLTFRKDLLSAVERGAVREVGGLVLLVLAARAKRNSRCIAVLLRHVEHGLAENISTRGVGRGV